MTQKTSPGLARLRGSADAERIRLQTLADQERALREARARIAAKGHSGPPTASGGALGRQESRFKGGARPAAGLTRRSPTMASNTPRTLIDVIRERALATLEAINPAPGSAAPTVALAAEPLPDGGYWVEATAA
jgi:hypothetical protein